MNLEPREGYYSRFDRSKKYKQLLTMAARGLQSAEFNEIQQITASELETIGNILFTEGSFISGGQAASDGDSRIVTFKEGIFWAKGFTHDVAARTLELGSVEDIYIGVGITQQWVTAIEDPMLTDPALNTANYQKKGADRLKITARWIRQEEKEATEEFFPIYHYVDGVRISNNQMETLEVRGIKDMIARYDRVNGSFVAEGLQLSYLTDDPIEKKHIITVGEGIGHVNGYEYRYDYARNVLLDFSSDFKSKTNEPIVFTNDSGSSEGYTGNYYLFKTPVRRITNLQGNAQTTETIVRDSDYTSLTGGMIISIDEVTYGGSQISDTYYEIWHEGQGIHWKNTSTPPIGSTVSIKYTFLKVAEEGVDYTILPTKDGIHIAQNAFLTGATCACSYEYYLPRYDNIIMSESGELEVIKGQPSDGTPAYPLTPYGLSLGYAYVLYGQTPTIINQRQTAYKYSDISLMQKQIESLNYSVSRLTLINDIRDQDVVATKDNIFVDSFLDDSMRDMGVEQNALVMGGLLLPEIKWNNRRLRSGSNILMSHLREAAVQSPAASETHYVSAYTSVTPPYANVTISPSAIRWLDEEVYKSINTESNARWTISTSTELVTDTEPRPVPQTNINVSGDTFVANEIIDILIDGLPVSTVNANSAGKVINATITTPEWLMSGSKQIVLQGRTSGSVGTAILTAVPQVATVKNSFASINRDPIAQTFYVDDDSFISSIELKFHTKPTTYVDVFLTSVESGAPERNKVVAKARKYPNDIEASTDASVWTTFTFDNPVLINSRTQYAIVVSSHDSNCKIWTAKLGQKDMVSGSTLNTQPYENGGMLESVNMSSWVSLSTSDLTFRVNKCVFSILSPYVYTYDTATSLNGITDVMLLTGVNRIAGSDTTFNMTLNPGTKNAETVDVAEYVQKSFAKYSGDILFSARMTSTKTNICSILDGNCDIAFGTVSPVSTYITRSFNISNEVGKVVVYLETKEPASGTRRGSISVEMRNKTDTAWIALSKSSSKTMSDGFVEWQYSLDGSQVLGMNSTRFRITLDMSSDPNLEMRPSARNLRAYFTATT